MLVHQARTLGLSGRGVHRVFRVARTIADLKGSDELTDEHMLEASGFRTA